MAIAVLSDLHVGIGARARDLCPEGLKTKAVESGYKDKFIEFLKKQSIRADYLVLPGDISHFAQPVEVQMASQIVLEVAETLKVEPERIVFVPGNHDVDWTVLRVPDSTGVRSKQRYDALRHEKWAFAGIMEKGNPHVLDPPYFSVWEFGDLLAVGYNSSWKDNPKEAIHHGAIDNLHLDALDEDLAKIDMSSSRLRMFLVHHHPIQYSDPVSDPPDFSVMTNAGNLLSLLQKYKFDLLIHGHKHIPKFQTYIVNASSPLAILCSGSFSVLLDTRWSGHVNNQFHMVYVEGRDDQLKHVYGRVESWTYLCGAGWVQSKSHNGIRHYEPFGIYIQPEELKKTLRPILQNKFSNKDFVVWPDILSEVAQLRFLPPERVTDVLNSLSADIGFKLHGELPTDLILLKTGGHDV